MELFSENESNYFSIFKCANSIFKIDRVVTEKLQLVSTITAIITIKTLEMELLDGLIRLPQCNLDSLLLASLFLLGSSRNFSCSCCTSRKWLIISRTGSIDIVEDVKLDLKVYALRIKPRQRGLATTEGCRSSHFSIRFFYRKLSRWGKHFFINGKNADENKYLIETMFRQTNLLFSSKSNRNKITIKNKEMPNVALLDVRARCVDLFIYGVKVAASEG